MLLYTKIIDDGHGKKVRKVFGTVGDVPSNADKEIICKDIDGDVEELVANDSYVDDGKGGIIRKSDGKFIGVFVKDGDNEVNVIPGDGWEPTEKTLKSIAVKTLPIIRNYIIDQELDLTGLTVEATYSDGDVTVVTDYTTTPAAGTVLDTAGTTTVTVSFENKTTTFSVTASDTITSLACTDSKDVYVVGEEYTTNELEVDYIYNNGAAEACKDFETSLAEGYVFQDSDIGEQTVTVTSTDPALSATYSITINER